jgi:hypothetical protein
VVAAGANQPAQPRRNELLKLNQSGNQELRKKSAPQVADPFHPS